MAVADLLPPWVMSFWWSEPKTLKLFYKVTQLLSIWSQWNFAHIMAPLLPWRVPNFFVITSSELDLEKRQILWNMDFEPCRGKWNNFCIKLHPVWKPVWKLAEWVSHCQGGWYCVLIKGIYQHINPHLCKIGICKFLFSLWSLVN